MPDEPAGPSVVHRGNRNWLSGERFWNSPGRWHDEQPAGEDTKMAHQHGATREEVAETVALAIYMGGGPAAVYSEGMRSYDNPNDRNP